MRNITHSPDDFSSAACNSGSRELAPLIERALRWFIAPGQVTELRALGVSTASYRRPHVEAGFYDYDHLENMAIAAAHLSGHAKGIYFMLNPLKADLLARRANRLDVAEEGTLAKDQDVLARRWLLIDADPIRDRLISATEHEKE